MRRIKKAVVEEFAISLVGNSLSWVFGHIFYFEPKIGKENGTLVAVSNWRTHLYSLGFGGRKVTVDPKDQVVTLAIRRFWFMVTRREIPFSNVMEVAYTYHDASFGAGAYREQDLFIVGLQLRGGKGVTLFRFYGNGSFANNTEYPDWMYWPQEVVANCTQGNQENASLAYAELISRMIGVPIGNADPALPI